MEAAVVGALLKTTLPRLFRVISDRCNQLKSNVRSIQEELELIDAALRDSPWRGKATSNFRRTWISQIKRLRDDIVRSLDSFEIRMTSATQFAKEIAELKERVKDSYQRLQICIVEEPSKAEVPPPKIIDAEEDLLTLVQTQSERAKLICAIGLGGQNTDIARRVWGKLEVDREFSQRACVSALDKTTDDVLTEILRELGNEPHPGLGMLILGWLLFPFLVFHHWLLNIFGARMPAPFPPGGLDVRQQLKSCLSKKRYLIVIDDMRTEEVYNEICAYYWPNGVGGRIIVRTNIPPRVRPCNCGNDAPPCAADRSTDGLVLVGEVGTGNLYEDTWPALCDLAIARTQVLLGSDEECLLYFSLFPCHHDVRRNSLIRRWLAEGLVVHAKQKVPEYVYRSDQEMAAKHLDILIAHNIIRPIKRSNNGKVKRCQPPGTVFSHICGRAIIENFNALLCGPNQLGERSTQEQEESVPRLSLHPYTPAANGGINVPNAPGLRTMAVFPTVGAQYGAILRFKKHRLLRVLDLKQCAHVNQYHVISICDLLLLKYLGLGNSIGRVPRKIRRLQRLETLDMRTTDAVTVYLELLQLPKLKHLLGKFRLSTDDCPDHKPGKIKKVLRLKGEFSKLKDFMMDNNSVLETLAGFEIGNGLGFSQLLSYMQNLTKVKIWCDSTADESTDLTDLKEGIKEFTSNATHMPIVDYSLSIDFTGPSQSLLDDLEDPARLTSLKLSGNLTMSLSFLAKMGSLQDLCLSRTNLGMDVIQAGLSNLTCPLKFLKLVEDNLMGLSLQNESPFRGLERICLVGTQSLEEITIQDLSKLVSLHLLCKDLGALPRIQIRSLPNLKEVGLHSQVCDHIKHGWEDAAKDHQHKPIVVPIKTY